ncbi:MAG: hypothetical protein RLO81_05460 [Fulvivirga sp.]|uniref:hypothetical protein n=1 Tax=Fulvivirga sp. TaxID=1931237 RepID=UPI0032EE9F5D
MKLLITHIALFTIIIHLFFTSGYLVDYYVNTDAYKARCENKAFPEMKCDGKCLLAKKIAMAKAEKPDEPAPIPTISSEYLYDLLELELNQKEPFSKTVRVNDRYINLYHFNYLHSLLKPPIG